MSYLSFGVFNNVEVLRQHGTGMSCQCAGQPSPYKIGSYISLSSTYSSLDQLMRKHVCTVRRILRNCIGSQQRAGTDFPAFLSKDGTSSSPVDRNNHENSLIVLLKEVCMSFDRITSQYPARHQDSNRTKKPKVPNQESEWLSKRVTEELEYGNIICAIRLTSTYINNQEDKSGEYSVTRRSNTLSSVDLTTAEEVSNTVNSTGECVGVPGGAEATVHVARFFPHHYAMVTLDFSNAFKFQSRAKILRCVQDKLPRISGFVNTCYSSSSCLFNGDRTIDSLDCAPGEAQSVFPSDEGTVVWSPAIEHGSRGMVDMQSLKDSHKNPRNRLSDLGSTGNVNRE
ncbi:hypothetical protein GJ496_002784 [Pomphorhynchus laevis]|nr:hypothetical protein GJ496_002784 [Pomphorhynchus laevis]